MLSKWLQEFRVDFIYGESPILDKYVKDFVSVNGTKSYICIPKVKAKRYFCSNG